MDCGGYVNHSMAVISDRPLFLRDYAKKTEMQCFKTDDQLIVAYSMTPAFG